MVDQNWLKFLREQYPVGSRIRLREMKDPYHPVEPGTMGTLTNIDDIGTFHVKWDNGRGLGLVMGEDSFTVLPPQTHLLKLYMPMTADIYERNQWGDLENEPVELDSYAAVEYADNIAAAIVRERLPEETDRGLMHYYHEDDSVNQKVQAFAFSVESRNHRLWGVAECKVVGELTPDELETLKEYVTGQASDGFGEGFEQREIRLSNGSELYAHLWGSGDGWSIQTEQEQFDIKVATGLPKMCFSVLPSTGDLICIKRGESGYYPSDWNTGNKAHNQELADYNNQRLGVTEAQRQAMECGSMHGWAIPGADPKFYEQDAPQMGGMTLG
ncbi:MAG: DUF4314 domain-containing protein [Clostridiales bacterium]|nr:DUF4314 domain-containing protein [Clostridiales bacterium]